MSEQELDDHASPNEAADALEQLGAADLLRLEYIAINRVRGLNHVEWEDLLQEAVARVMAGSREWPRKVPLIVFLAGVMRSIASECRDQRDRTAEVGIVLEAETQQGEEGVAGVIDAAPSSNPGPDRDLDAKRELAAIEELFVGDEDAWAIIVARAEGYLPAEIQGEFEITATRYDSALKRIRRRLNAYDMERTEQ